MRLLRRTAHHPPARSALARLLPLYLAGCTAGVTACATPRYVPPTLELPRPPAPSADARQAGGVRIKRLTINCSSDAQFNIWSPQCDSQRELEVVGNAIGSHLEQAFPVGRDQAPHALAIAFDARWRSNQTVFFDGLAALSAGLFPLVPQWGTSRITATLELASPAAQARGLRGESLLLVLDVPYTTFFYSWFRAGPASAAFVEAWQLIAPQVVARLEARLAAAGRLPPPASGPASGPTTEPTVLDPYAEARRAPTLTEMQRTIAEHRRSGDSGPPPTPTGPPERGSTSWQEELAGRGEGAELRGSVDHWLHQGEYQERTTVALHRGDDEEWQLMTAARVKPTPRGLFHKYLSAFGGLEGGYFLGKAWVSSEAHDDRGRSYTVAAGQATTRGYRIGFYTVPTKSDWFLFPTLGFFSLDINIADFRENIPQVAVAGAQEIPAVGSNPATGAPVDLGDPNVYRLALRSMYLGQRLSGTLVYGTPVVNVFATLEGGFNLFEVRHMRVDLGTYTAKGWGVAWARSAQLRAIAGLAIRPWHMALRVEGNYEHYWSYSFPEPVPFMGRVEYDPTISKYIRPTTTVSAAAAGTLNVLFSLNLYY